MAFPLTAGHTFTSKLKRLGWVWCFEELERVGRSLMSGVGFGP